MAETDFYQICHCDKTKAKTVTMILEEKSIADGSYILPPGHSSTIKNVQQIENKISFDLVSMSGVRIENRRMWPIIPKYSAEKSF